MQVTIREEPSGTLVSIVGSVDSLTASDLQAAMTGAQQNGQTRLVADFSGVEYTSSAGLRVILATAKELRQKGGDLRIAGARPNVLRVLEVSGFTSILKLFPDAATALTSFAS
jgi:anti-sigma B factor antagonist